MSVLIAAALASSGGLSNATEGTTSSQAFWVPLENLDPNSMSLLYIVGDQAAVTPVWQYVTFRPSFPSTDLSVGMRLAFARVWGNTRSNSLLF